MDKGASGAVSNENRQSMTLPKSANNQEQSIKSGGEGNGLFQSLVSAYKREDQEYLKKQQELKDAAELAKEEI